MNALRSRMQVAAAAALVTMAGITAGHTGLTTVAASMVEYALLLFP